MTYTKKQFLEDVAKEAVALKKHATVQELERLDYSTFSATSESGCVYGQMTGHCSSKRAHELIRSCCIRLVDNGKWTRTNFRSVYKAVNGPVKSIEQLNELRGPSELYFISQMEAYIQGASAKNKNLIDFLKGNRTDLVL